MCLLHGQSQCIIKNDNNKSCMESENYLKRGNYTRFDTMK